MLSLILTCLWFCLLIFMNIFGYFFQKKHIYGLIVKEGHIKRKHLRVWRPLCLPSGAPSCSGGPDFWVSIKKFLVCKIDPWVENFFGSKFICFSTSYFIDKMICFIYIPKTKTTFDLVIKKYIFIVIKLIDRETIMKGVQLW